MANLDHQQGKEEEADDGDIDSLFEDEEEEEDQGVDTFGKQDENNEFAQEEEDNHTTSTDPGHRHGYDHHHANSQDSSDEPDAEKLERVKAKLRRMQENQKAQKESRRAIFINKALNPEKTITKGPARSSIINSSKPVSKTKKSSSLHSVSKTGQGPRAGGPSRTTGGGGRGSAPKLPNAKQRVAQRLKQMKGGRAVRT
jgi:hypothetical protein